MKEKNKTKLFLDGVTINLKGNYISKRCENWKEVKEKKKTNVNWKTENEFK